MPEANRPLIHSERRTGGWTRIVISQPPANVLTMAICEALRESVALAGVDPQMKLISIEGAGGHFSYGASVEEHLPGKVGQMLPSFHALVEGLLAVPCPTAAIVRGRCLGGALEIALACDVVFASTDAHLGVPEIALGVFPPAAAALLPLRVGASRAARVILTGEALPASWWEAAGLVSATASPGDLERYVQHWFDTFAAPRSAVALRHAARAARAVLRRLVQATLADLERQYLDELMKSQDAAEGCTAFLEKRQPSWKDR